MIESSKSILITESVHDLLPEGLLKLGFAVTYLPKIQRAEVLNIIEEFHGLIINSKIVADAELIAKAKRLRFIARCGSGREVMDIPFAEARGVKCITSPEGNRHAVAEHALGMLLNIMNNMHIAHRQVQAGEWLREENRGSELGGKTVGIIGYGNTGEAFAKVLAGFNVRVLAYDKYRSGFSEGYIYECELEEIFEQADVVSFHLPLTEETKHFANDGFFNAFKKNVWLINTARGANIQTRALLRALKSGKVVAAALDVLENEKIQSLNPDDELVFKELAAMPNVLVTPHIAGWTHESKRKIAETLLQKIAALTLD